MKWRHDPEHFKAEVEDSVVGGYRLDSEFKTSKDDAAHPRQRRLWTNADSFYVFMGDFAYDTAASNLMFFPDGCTRMTLTVSETVLLAEANTNLIPDLSLADISDKSKASGLAKFLVVVQALWFGVQCIVRLFDELGLSLLELNVFGHALCALLLYCFWWDKPLDILEFTPLSSEQHLEYYALMCISSAPQYFSEAFYASPHSSLR